MNSRLVALLRIFLAFAILASSAVAVSAETTATPLCRTFARSVVPMPDDKVYAVILRSASADASDLRLTLYSVSKAYAVALSGVAFTPAGGAFESQPYFVTLPASDIVIGAAVEPAAAGLPATCDAQYMLTDYLLRQVNPSYSPSDELKLERLGLNRRFVQGVTATPVSAVTENDNCAQAYTPARVKDQAVPTFTLIQPNATTGSAGVVVSLDAKGNVLGARVMEASGTRAVDDAVLGAALKSSYAPATFLCRNIASVYFMKLGLRSTTTTTTTNGRPTR